MKGKKKRMPFQIKMTSKAINNPKAHMTITDKWSLVASLVQDCLSIWRKNLKQQEI